MDQQLRVYTILARRPGYSSSIYVGGLTTTWNSSSRVSEASGLQESLHSCVHTPGNTHAYTYINKGGMVTHTSNPNTREAEGHRAL